MGREETQRQPEYNSRKATLGWPIESDDDIGIGASPEHKNVQVENQVSELGLITQLTDHATFSTSPGHRTQA